MRNRGDHIMRWISGIILTILTAVITTGPAMGHTFRDKSGRSVNTVEENLSMSTERLFIHTDRDIYIAGEKILFALYLVDNANSLEKDGSRIAYIELFDNENTVVGQTKCLLQDGIGNGEIAIPSSATTGDYRIRAYTSYMKNFGPLYFHYYHVKIFNPFIDLEKDANVTVSPDPQRTGYKEKVGKEGSIKLDIGSTYSAREKVTIRFGGISIPDNSPIESSNLSISVSVPSRLTSNQGVSDISGTFRLKDDPIAENIRFRMEKSWANINGKFLRKGDMQPARGRLFASFPGLYSWVYYSDTDEEGNFSFKLPVELGNREVVIQPSLKNDDEFLVRITSPFEERFNPASNKPFLADSLLLYDAARWSTNFQVRQVYREKLEKTETTEEPIFTDNFFGIPDKRLLMKDYVVLPLMEEVFYELISGVALKEENGAYSLQVTDNTVWQKYATPPALFLDGIFIHDAGIVANLDPEIVEQIDVIRERYQLGDITFEGIIDIKTINLQSVGLNPGQSSVRTTFAPYNLPGEFLTPVYDTPEKLSQRIPDRRNTLYWNPHVQFDSEGTAIIEFYTSDFISDYEIRIQGFDSKGEPVSINRAFQVKE